MRFVFLALMVLLFVGQAFAQYQNVVPVDWSKYTGMTGIQSGDTFGQDVSTILQNQSRYLYNWVASDYTLQGFSYFGEVPGYYKALGGESNIRPLAHFAWGNAVMLRTGTYNAGVTGLSESDALLQTEYAIRGVAMTYCANRNFQSGWGHGGTDSWQAAYWASRGAQAAWMLWDSLSVETKTAVTTMVKNEADYFINYTVPYWRNPDGSTNSPGNTRADDNAWNSRVLSIAQAMLPNDPNVNLWRQKASELMVSSYSRESDIYNTTLVDGTPVNEWINGYNTFDDGVLVNHNIVHPGYMMIHTLTYDTMVDSTLAGQYIPESAFFNEQVNWDAETKLNFVAGQDPYGTGHVNLSPGGTVFHKKPDGSLDPTPYYPNGDDWSSNPASDVNYVLHLMYGEVRGLDAGEEVDAMDWIDVEIDALRGLQLRSGHDGNIYQSGDWASAQDENEVDTYRELTEAWLVHWLDQNSQLSPISDHWGTVPDVFVWTNAAGGSWQTAGNWATHAVLDMTGKTGEFSNPLNPNATVSLDADATVGGLLFDNAGGYTITGSGILTLSSGSSGTNQIEVDAGNHEIAVAAVLNGSTEVDVAAGQLLTMSGPVGGAGDFTKSGEGRFVLTQDLLFSGNLTVAAGEMDMTNVYDPTMNLSVIGDARLTARSIRADTLIIGGTALAGVPEPGTWALLLSGLLGIAIARKIRFR
ncbi:MAG: PEP-CTERM sorting domain-containing protein [Pirellulales bacterium]|nr:PEP-CTERM sorting domain-containing protein [Pirellulales bacterium]